jgi:hypothetical protein
MPLTVAAEMAELVRILTIGDCGLAAIGGRIFLRKMENFNLNLSIFLLKHR